MPGSHAFDRSVLEFALAELGRRCHAAGRTVEIAIYGGSAILLILNNRIATRDVDGVFEKDKNFLKRLATDMANEFGWNDNWLNDGVKGFLSVIDGSSGVKHLFKTYPSEEQPGLRVFLPKAEYLFAMKCRAMRIGGVDSNSDIDDIRMLARAIGIRNSEEALNLVEAYYPGNLIEPKTRFGLEEIFTALGDQTPKPAGSENP
jgi:hypothetical protein